MKLKRPSKEEIEKLYLIERKSPEEIGSKYGVSGRCIRDLMKSLGVSRLGPSFLRNGKSAHWNKGIIRSPETREKIRMSKIGHTPWNKGFGLIKFRCKSCGSEVVSHKYRKKTTCSRACYLRIMTKSRGIDHWNFSESPKIGLTQRRRLWIDVQEWRNGVISKHKSKCQKCNRTEKDGIKITSHHLYNWAHHPDKITDPENGACLCWGCHREFHRKHGQKTNPEMFYKWVTT